jgi:Na+/H+-dicarboxylate symporter
MLKDPVLVAFTTSSSEAAYPKTLEQLTKFGCSPNIVSFVLPIGYSFNLVGSMVYCSFASMFIAQAYNIHLSFAEITVLMLTLMLASKGLPVCRVQRWWYWRQPSQASIFRLPEFCY